MLADLEYEAGKEERKAKGLLRLAEGNVATYGVVCPKCFRFSSAALDTHFTSGLTRTFARRLACNGIAMVSTAAIIFAILMPAAIAICGVLSEKGLPANMTAVEWIAAIMVGGLASAGLLGFVKVAIEAFWSLRALFRIPHLDEQIVDSCSASACLAVGNLIDFRNPWAFTEQSLLPEAARRLARSVATDLERQESSSSVARVRCKCGKHIRVRTRTGADARRIKCPNCHNQIPLPVAQPRISCNATLPADVVDPWAELRKGFWTTIFVDGFRAIGLLFAGFFALTSGCLVILLIAIACIAALAAFFGAIYWLIYREWLFW
jgi:hypothetical protein